MNYTQTIRNYISERKGEFFEITYERKKYFHMIPDKTLMKVLNRLEVEGLLLSIAKGLYFINDGNEYSSNKLIEYYGLNDRGIATGYVLFNNLGLTDYKDDSVVIYTNELGIKSKTIGNIQLKKMDLVSFDHKTKSIITALELLEKGFNNIIDCDCIKTIVVLEKCLLEYHDFLFEDIIRNHKYSNITILKLQEQLNRLLIPNNCVEIYLKMKRESQILF